MRYLLSLLLATANACFAADPTPLTQGQPIVRDISGSQSQRFSIAMQDGQYAGLLLRDRGIDFTAHLIAPDGSSIDLPVPQRNGDEESTGFVAQPAGLYRLEIKAPYRATSGRYEILLTETRPANAHDRSLSEAMKLCSQATQLDRSMEYEKEIPVLSKAAEIFERELGPQHAVLAHWLSVLGNLYYRRGAYDQAEPLLRRALEIDEKTLGADHPDAVAAMKRLGTTYFGVGDYAQSEQWLGRALELAEKTRGKTHPAVADCLMDLANLHDSRGDGQRAVQELKRALAIAETALDPGERLINTILNNLGLVYLNQRDFAHAEPLFQRAVAHAREYFGADHPLQALPLWNLALIAQQRDKDFPRALEQYEKALALLERSLGPQHPYVGSILNNTGNIYKSTGDYARALELHQRVLDMWEKSLGPYHSKTIVSLGNIARTYAAMGDAESTIKFQTLNDRALEQNLALNLAVGSERQKLAYFNSVAERTDRTISYQVKLAPDSQRAARLAALAALQRKGRVLDAMSLNLSSLRQRMNGPQDQTLLDSWTAATGQFARLTLNGPGLLSPAVYQSRLADLAEKRDRAEAEVSRRSAGFISPSLSVSLETVQAAIPRDAALIEFATWRPFNAKLDNDEAYGERRYIAYVLHTTGDVLWKDLGAARETDGAVDEFRRALADPERLDVRRMARELDHRLMEPLRALLGDSTRLLMSPEGPLNLLPVQALVDERGRYLVERYSISYLSSGRDLLRMQTARSSHTPAVIVADPTFDEPDGAPMLQIASSRRGTTIAADLKDLYFAPLAGTAQEARAIHSLIPNARMLTGRDATESTLKHVDAPSILHIATHGFFLPGSSGNPLLRSGLALAGANRRNGDDDDGIFTALEASGLNLWGTRLVTLSACDSGIGEVHSGEGVYGLRRAFVLAGAESLVMSLWPVSDSVTREMMTAFYAGLQRGLGRGEALRQVQLAILKRKGREHPFYWASFIQSGEWANLAGRR
jgi:CHAT domain-containing protein/Tfp pilus assembly protein PilF